MLRRTSEMVGQLKDGIVGAFARTQGELVVSQIEQENIDQSNSFFFEKPTDGFVKENGSCWNPNAFGQLQLAPCTKTVQKWTQEPSPALYDLSLHRPIVKGLPFVAVFVFNDTKFLLPMKSGSNLLVPRACPQELNPSHFLSATDKGEWSLKLAHEAFITVDMTSGKCIPTSEHIEPIDNCRPECFAPVKNICFATNKSSIAHHICRNFDAHRGPIAAIVKKDFECPFDSTETFTVTQQSSKEAKIQCSNGFLIIVDPGSNYTNGQASLSNGDVLHISVATALIQPFSTDNAVFGIGVDIINISDFTQIFGKAFESVLFKASTAKGYYTAAAGICITAATVLFVMSIHTIVSH